jgi:hypothetical protein
MKRIALTVVVVVCALVVPPAALAQSAGDNQYTDPLASPHSGTKSTPNGSSGSSGSSTPAPSQGTSAGSSSGTAGTTSSSAAPSSTSGRALPRTGGHPELIAVAGLVLLAGGFGLRRAGRRAEEPADFESVFLRFG